MPAWGTRPLGALAGGFVAEAAGLRAPFIVGGILRAVILLALLPALLVAARPAAPKGPSTCTEGKGRQTVGD
jgi:hypothetical protein